jgi:ABC-type nickel/cobalt efflux system permease component RcnA
MMAQPKAWNSLATYKKTSQVRIPSMLYVLGLGFLIGMKHAIEADHVAAVASLATRASTVGETARFGIAWGLGHTLTLFLVGTTVLLAGASIPEHFAEILEFIVGLMLIGLGIDVLARIWRERTHFHAHAHDGDHHFHAHKHAEQNQHNLRAHSHAHPKGFPVRALMVGLMHGMAGSAALVLLALSTITSVWLGIGYILLFGLGSIAGMALLSCAIAVPLRLSADRVAWASRGLTVAIGVATVMLGASIAWRGGISGGLWV